MLSLFNKNLILLVCFLLCTGCSHLLYHPAKGRLTNIDKLKYKPKSIFIKNEFGDSIEIWNFKNKTYPPNAVFVFFHGNAENISTHFASLYWVLEKDYDYVIFDYPGYGESTGVPTPESTVKTGMDVLKWTRKKYPKTPIVVFGQSLGGAVGLRSTIESQHEVNPCLVVVDSTFPSYQMVTRSVLRGSWLSWPLQPLSYLLMSDDWAPGKAISKISPTPLLILHSEDDKVVRYEMGQEVYNYASDPKEIWKYKGPHISALNGKEASKWREKLLKKVTSSCDLN